MQVITANETHIPVVAKLFDAYRTWYHQTPDLEGATAYITERLWNKDSVILLAIDNDEAVGFTQLYPIFSSVRMSRAWLLNDLFVDEHIRSKGAGTALLEAAQEMGKASGAKWMMLQTDIINTGAQALYERKGYVKDGHCYYYYLDL